MSTTVSKDEYFGQVEKSGEDLVAMDNRRPVIEVATILVKTSAAAVFSDVRGPVGYREDLLAPTTDEWPET